MRSLFQLKPRAAPALSVKRSNLACGRRGGPALVCEPVTGPFGWLVGPAAPTQSSRSDLANKLKRGAAETTPEPCGTRIPGSTRPALSTLEKLTLVGQMLLNDAQRLLPELRQHQWARILRVAPGPASTWAEKHDVAARQWLRPRHVERAETLDPRHTNLRIPYGLSASISLATNVSPGDVSPSTNLGSASPDV